MVRLWSVTNEERMFWICAEAGMGKVNQYVHTCDDVIQCSESNYTLWSDVMRYDISLSFVSSQP